VSCRARTRRGLAAKAGCSAQAGLQRLLQLLADVVRRGRSLPRGAPGSVVRLRHVVRLRLRLHLWRGRRHPAQATPRSRSSGRRGPAVAAADLRAEVLHGAPEQHVVHAQRLQLPPHQRERRVAVRRRVRGGQGGCRCSAAGLGARDGARGLLDADLAHDQQRHLADGRASALAVGGEQLRRHAQAPVEPQARPAPQREHAPGRQPHAGQQRADPAAGPRRRHVGREPAPGERERRHVVQRLHLPPAVGARLPGLPWRWRRRGGAQRVREREVAEPRLEAEEEGGRRGGVVGDEVELGGERERRACRGPQRAEPRAHGEREGERRVVGAVREPERRARCERRGHVEAELPQVPSRREPRLERQPQHDDRHLGAHQRPLVVAELDRRLHRAG
jgi:hypothetical protein